MQERLTRQDVFITTKLAHPGQNLIYKTFDWTAPDMEEKLRRDFGASLDELNVGYVDLLLVHWPGDFATIDKPETKANNRILRRRVWGVFEALYNAGAARAIGVSNFTEEHLRELIEDGAEVVPHVNQIEYSPHCQYTKILSFCQEHNIVVQAFSPLGSTAGAVLRDPVLVAMAEKYGKNPGQLALKWLVQQGIVVLPRSSSEARLRSNMDIFDFEISAEDMAAITARNKGGTVTNKSPYAIP